MGQERGFLCLVSLAKTTYRVRVGVVMVGLRRPTDTLPILSSLLMLQVIVFEVNSDSDCS